MRILSKLFKKPEKAPVFNGNQLYAPMNGRTVPLSEVPDPTFAAELLGKGIAIIPTDGRVLSPVDGVVETMLDSGHACALTSNPGSRDFQFTESVSGTRLFEDVLTKAQEWATDEEIMFVVGATQGEMFADIRRCAPTNFLLVPGVGAQGGDLATVCRFGMTEQCGLLVNSSRGIIFASREADYAEAAARAARTLAAEMDTLLKEYSKI